MKRMKYLIRFFLFIFLITSGSNTAFASTTEKAELFFYTVDGDELESLHTSIRSDKEYTFADPDRYKYIAYAFDENDNPVYPDLYDQVKGICWQEVNENDSMLGKYEAGQKASFSPGRHYFYVKTDNPVLTHENDLHTSISDMVYIDFETADYTLIDELSNRLTIHDTYTFPDPSRYVTIEAENGYGYAGSGQGILWSGEDESGKRYLFEAGDKVKFNRGGSYVFHVVTDDPVIINFRYPMENMVIDKAEGDVYRQISAKPGDKLTLLKSLGAIIWDETFVGWDEYNYFFDRTYPANYQLTIYDNVDLDFYAVYEYDENWDPDAKDENTGRDPSENGDDRVITVDIATINAQAGVGFEAYVTSDGKVVRKNGNNKVNDKVAVNGVPGDIKGSEKKQESNLTSLESGGDPKDAGSYKKDKYGRDAEDSNINDHINGVLRQDDSAFYMDIYGNSMLYHSTYSRILDMAVAYRRLKSGKNDSFLLTMSGWDPALIDRYEAIEFALISGQYPGDNNSPYKQFNSNSDSVKQIKISIGLTGDEKLPEWKDTYLSKEAFKALSVYKKLWKGWYDEYTDNPVQDGNFDSIRKVSSIVDGAKDLLSRIDGLFTITAYAAEPNNAGQSNRLNSRINDSTDLKSSVMTPKYYDASLMSTYSGWYMLNGLSGLDSTSQANLSKIFNALIDHGYSEAMAIGACGNLWQENEFRATSTSSAAGIAQWTNSRKTSLIIYCTSKKKSSTDIDAQIDYMLYELTTVYDKKMNDYFAKHGGGVTVKSVSDFELACEAFCVVFEGCTCVNNGVTHSYHNDACAYASNGKSYQHLNTRLSYARQISQVARRLSGGSGGFFAGGTNADILESIYGYSTIKQIAAYMSPSERKKYITSITLSDGKMIWCNKYIADDLKAALDEIIAIGFPLDNTIYSYAERSTNSGGLSFHSLGLAIDINCGSGGGKSMGWAHNPQFYYSKYSMDEIIENYQPYKDPYAITTIQYEILKSYGFLWGRDFKSQPDIMHFVIGEVAQDGYHSEISQNAESFYRSYK